MCRATQTLLRCLLPLPLPTHTCRSAKLATAAAAGSASSTPRQLAAGGSTAEGGPTPATQFPRSFPVAMEGSTATVVVRPAASSTRCWLDWLHWRY